MRRLAFIVEIRIGLSHLPTAWIRKGDRLRYSASSQADKIDDVFRQARYRIFCYIANPREGRQSVMRGHYVLLK